MLGVAVTVTEQQEWVLGEGSLEVGLGYYERLGYGARDAALLAIRDLWAATRGTRRAHGRAFRRLRLERSDPRLSQLLIALDRFEADAELSSAMPGVARGLTAVTLRGIPADLRGLPLPTQWIGLLSRMLAGGDTVVDEPVQQEYEALCAVDGRGWVLLAALRGGQDDSAVDRLDRALAACAPAYLRLAEHGVGGLPSTGGSAAGAADDGIELGTGVGGGSPEAMAGEEAGDAEGEYVEETLDVDARVTAGEEAEIPLAGLVEIAGEEPPELLLDTPLPATHPGLGVLSMQDPGVAAHADPATAPPDDVATGLGAAALSEYRSRLSGYRAEIDRTREAWRLVLGEQLRVRRAARHWATPDGGELHLGRLPETVAEVAAGVARPAAFRVDGTKARQEEGLGNTDIVLVLDRSGSMGGQAADLCADAAMVMVESVAAVDREIAELEAEHDVDLGISVRSALLVFDDVPTILKRLAEPPTEAARAKLHAEVRKSGGATQLVAALHAAAEELGNVGEVAKRERPRSVGRAAVRHAQRRQILVCVTDGDVGETRELAATLRSLRASGVQTIGIGIGLAPGIVAFAPDDRRIRSVRELPHALAALIGGSASGVGAGA